MTNKYKYFVANWKMFGDIKSVNSINRVIKLSKSRKFKKAKIIYCPPYTLINNFVQKLKKTKIDVGAQNCHQSDINGPFTGSINSKMIKNAGAKYIIIGHSENRIEGDTNKIINNFDNFSKECSDSIKIMKKNRLKILYKLSQNLTVVKDQPIPRDIFQTVDLGLFGVGGGSG